MTVTGLNVHDLLLMMEKEERLNAEMAELPMWNLWRAASLEGGDDVADNLVPLCRECHHGVHLREPAHCRLLLTRLSDAEYSYMVQRGGEDYAERVYGIGCER